MPAHKLDQIQTIVIVMMENRSFDHMLGYLSLPDYGAIKVEGLKDDAGWQKSIASIYNNTIFPPWRDYNPFRALAGDPPHERDDITLQLGPTVNGKYEMKGFVENLSHATAKPLIDKDHLPEVMGYFTPEEVPISDFLARNFRVCDHWFSALPAGTQANRLMAMSGYTLIDKNVHILPNQHLVYDWLTERRISWRVYHEGMPFFSMMLNWTPQILNDNLFRRFDQLVPDISEAARGEMPQVIFLEPAYTDAPHIGPSSDDHAPSGASAGQEFLMKVYNAVTYDPTLWQNTVMIITYDEHGGFFDHVSPPPVKTTAPETASYAPFETLGVRVPGFVVSPFVKPGQPFNSILDHTSILKFLGQRFSRDSLYSPQVDSRHVGSVLDVLDLGAKAQCPAAPELNEYVGRAQAAGRTSPDVPLDSEIMKSFQTALDALHAHSAPATESKFPELTPFITRI
jgi:phospholipase C